MARTVNTIYLDCFSGISGDMFLGGLLSVGLPQELLEDELAKLNLEPFDLKAARTTSCSISAISVTISSKSQQQFRNLGAIEDILHKSSLDDKITSQSLNVFTRLAEAEATVHGKPVKEIHFHEVGALDTIVDIVGSIAGLYHLGIQNIYSSPLPLGRGFVSCAHGTLPLPAPAVCTLLKDVPVYGVDATDELVTPTGAALVSTLVDHFGHLPPMTPVSTGYGAGDRPGTDNKPNLLRIITGYLHEVIEAQEVEIIETNLDDWNSEGFPFLCEQLFAHHALDVSLIPIQMKKGRPGYCLRVICHPHDSIPLKEIILTETSAIGLRFRTEQRMTLPRTAIEVQTRWGAVTAKQVETSRGLKIYPEYESCRIIAKKNDVPLDLIYREVIAISQR